MGIFSRLFYSPECFVCGGSNFIKVAQYGECQMLACKKCNKVLGYYKIPLCACCGKAMKGSTINSNGAYVPKCTNCGHIYDGDEQGWIDLRE